MVVVDRFNKMAHFIPIKRKCHGSRDEKVFFHARFQTSWLPQGHCVGLRPKVHKQVLASLVETHGVRA